MGAGAVTIVGITDPIWALFGLNLAEEQADWLAQAVAAASAVASIAASAQYLNIAEDYYDLYREQRDFYNLNFQYGAEQPFATEVFAEPVYVADYSGASTMLNNDMLVYLDGFELWYERKMRMYHMPNFLNTATHTPQEVDRAAHMDDWNNYTYARERHLEDVYNARRFSRMLDAANAGVKQGTAVERGLATSFPLLDAAYGNVGDFFAVQSNGLARMSGYFRAREDIQLAGEYRRGQEISASRSGYTDVNTGVPVNIPIGMNERLG